MRTVFDKRWRRPLAILQGLVLSGMVVAIAALSGLRPQSPTVDGRVNGRVESLIPNWFGPKPEPPSAGVRVNHTITTVPQAAADGPEEFRSLFVEEAAVPETDREKYMEYGFFARSPDVCEGSCIALVTVQDVHGNDLSEVEWTLELCGETWKLKSAPLP